MTPSADRPRGLVAVVILILITVTALAAAGSGAARTAVPAGGVSGVPARVEGSFVMNGLITAAVDVRGEHAGEQLTRRWTIRPYDCVDSTCDRLAINRSRGAGRPLSITLRRVGHAYRGSAVFFSALSCLGRTYLRGSRAPYTITLRVLDRTLVGTVWYATTVYATYRNLGRNDRTPCPLGPSSDAAHYRGTFRSAAPAPNRRAKRLSAPASPRRSRSRRSDFQAPPPTV